jgi:hypothetical protein
MSTEDGPVFVTSNQSTAYGELPRAHGATSEMMIPFAACAVPLPPHGAMAVVAAATVTPVKSRATRPGHARLTHLTWVPGSV